MAQDTNLQDEHLYQANCERGQKEHNFCVPNNMNVKLGYG